VPYLSPHTKSLKFSTATGARRESLSEERKRERFEKVITSEGVEEVKVGGGVVVWPDGL
jgi:hypothetical protein